MAKNTSSQSDIKQAAIELVRHEVNQWEDAVAYVTENIAFQMRNMIRSFRKNYFGIFDKPYDSTTGKKKIFVPLTESTVDAVRKNIDIDTKDINFRAKRRDAIGLTQLVRNISRSYLDQMNFGEILDRFITSMSVDGTAIWKTYVVKKGNKKSIEVKLVDTLNFYIDPTADCIQEATVIERAALDPSELAIMDGWMDTEGIDGSDTVSRNEKDSFGTQGVDLIDVYERWGLMSKYLVTGKEKDRGEMIDGHIVVSGLGSNSGPRVHLIEENKEKDIDGFALKPYEEGWYSRVPGRWYGRGPAEKVMYLQVWLNTIVNIRINRSYVSQLGIFKVRKGSGITPQMMSGLAANGAVVLNNMDDLQQLPVQDASQASYNDEEIIKGWAQTVTSTFDTAVGENLPASTPATNAVIQSRASQSQFFLVKEGIGMFLQRWMKRQFLPKLGEVLTKNEIALVTGETDEIRALDKKVANKLVLEKSKELLSQGRVVNPQSVMKARDRILAKLEAQGGDRFVKMLKSPDLTAYDVQVFVTNEEFDKGVMVQNLTSLFQTVAAVPGLGIDPAAVADSIFDLMGIDTRQYKQEAPPQAPPGLPQGAIQQGQPQGAPAPTGRPVQPVSNPQQQFETANTAV